MDLQVSKNKHIQYISYNSQPDIQLQQQSYTIKYIIVGLLNIGGGIISIIQDIKSKDSPQQIYGTIRRRLQSFIRDCVGFITRNGCNYNFRDKIYIDNEYSYEYQDLIRIISFETNDKLQIKIQVTAHSKSFIYFIDKKNPKLREYLFYDKQAKKIKVCDENKIYTLIQHSFLQKNKQIFINTNHNRKKYWKFYLQFMREYQQINNKFVNNLNDKLWIVKICQNQCQQTMSKFIINYEQKYNRWLCFHKISSNYLCHSYWVVNQNSDDNNLIKPIFQNINKNATVFKVTGKIRQQNNHANTLQQRDKKKMVNIFKEKLNWDQSWQFY